MDEDQRFILGDAVRRARLTNGWGKEEAGRRAGVSSITWKRVEDGKTVQDANLAKVLAAAGVSDRMLDDAGADYAAAMEALVARLNHDYLAAGGDPAQAEGLSKVAAEIRARIEAEPPSRANWWTELETPHATRDPAPTNHAGVSPANGTISLDMPAEQESPAPALDEQRQRPPG